MPIVKTGGVIVETPVRDDDQFQRTGVVRSDQFAISDDIDVLKQVKFDTSAQTSDTVVTLKTPGVSASSSVTLEAAQAENALGNSGATTTVDFSVSPNQSLTLTGSPGCTLTFTAPPAGSTVLLKLVQGSGGSKTATFPATVKWPMGTAPTLSTTAADIDICTFYFDGTNYFGNSSLDYA